MQILEKQLPCRQPQRETADRMGRLCVVSLTTHRMPRKKELMRPRTVTKMAERNTKQECAGGDGRKGHVRHFVGGTGATRIPTHWRTGGSVRVPRVGRRGPVR